MIENLSNGVEVYTNECNEIFVTAGETRIRIHCKPTADHGNGEIMVTSQGGRIQPWSHNGLPAFIVTPRNHK